MDEIAIRDPRPGDAEALEALITAHFSDGQSYGVDLVFEELDFILVDVRERPHLGVRLPHEESVRDDGGTMSGELGGSGVVRVDEIVRIPVCDLDVNEVLLVHARRETGG